MTINVKLGSIDLLIYEIFLHFLIWSYLKAAVVAILFPPEGPILNCPAMGSIFNFRSMLKIKLCKEPPYDTFMHN